MSLLLDELMDEIFDVLDAAGIGLVVPAEGSGVRARPPAPYVELPTIQYQEPGPGLNRIPELGLTIVFGPANNSKVFRTALQYASPAGPKSVRVALMAHHWTKCGTLFVTAAEPGVEVIQGKDPAITYTFKLQITGG
jgi:hypothetical protein